MPRNCAKNSAQGKDPDASYLGDKNVTQTKKPPKPAAFPCCERCVRARIPDPGGTVRRYLTPITSISIFSSGMASELEYEARDAIADLVGADPDGVVLGPNRAVLLDRLAEAVGRARPGARARSPEPA